MLKFLKCSYCSDILLLSKRVKSCECGACLGSETGQKEDGTKIYSHSGKGMTFQIPEEALNQPEGGKFIGFISSKQVIQLGKKINTRDGVVAVR